MTQRPGRKGGVRRGDGVGGRQSGVSSRIDGWRFPGGAFLGVVGETACVGGFGCWLWGFREGCRVSEAGDSTMRSKIPLFCRLTLACRVSTYISSSPSLKHDIKEKEQVTSEPQTPHLERKEKEGKGKERKGNGRGCTVCI